MPVRRIAIVGCWLLMIASPALSQTSGGPAPLGGMFGMTRSEKASPDRLRFLLDASEAIDSELAPEFRSRLQTADPQAGGLSSMLIASADYVHNQRRLQVDGQASTAFRYYPGLAQVSAANHSARLRTSLRLPKRGSLQVSQSASYSPSYLYRLFPTDTATLLETPPEAAPEYRVDATQSYSYGTGIGLAFGSTRGTRISTNAEYERIYTKQDVTAIPTLTTHVIGLKVSRAVTRNAGLFADYQYRAGDFALSGQTTEHRLAIGADYSMAVSAKRHATFRFSVAPSTLAIPQTFVTTAVAGKPVTGGETRLNRLEAEGGADYEFRPHWRATAAYRRGVEYLVVLAEPVFSEGMRADLAGLVGRRIDVLMTAGYAIGASALQRDTQTLDTYTGTVRVRYALRRSMALYSEYLYYNYDLRGQAHLAPGLPSAFEQHRLRIGFILIANTLGR